MGVKQTSLLSYEEILPSLGKRQALVYSCIERLGSITNLQISRNLKLPINSVTPRVLELRKKGLVIEDKVIIQETGKAAQAWRVR